MKLKHATTVLAVALTLLLGGCSSTPDNIVYKYDSTSNLIGWDHGQKVFEHNVLIKPTLGQSFHYAKQTDWVVARTFALIFLVLFCVFGFLAVTDNLPKLFDNALIRDGVLFVLLVTGLGLFGGRPGSIWLNNNHWVPEGQYKYYMVTQKDITPIWDSLANNCHMSWGPTKGCKD